MPIIGSLVVIIAANLAQTRAPAFYAADMPQPDGKPTGVFAFLAQQRWPSVVAVNMRPGLVIMASPQTQTRPGGLDKMCARATERGALLVVGTNETEDVAAERAVARNCGTVRYDDGAALVVQP